MAQSLLYTIGNSDIKINDHQRFEGFYDTTKEVLGLLKRDGEARITDKGFALSGKEVIPVKVTIKGSVESHEEPLETVEFPIFIPILTKVVKDSHKKPDRIFLFGTEQEPPDPQDTYYAAELVKLFASKRYRIACQNIMVMRVNEPPWDYDQMSDYFSRFFEENQHLKHNTFNYISLTAGTPALTTNIALRSMDLSVKYLYLPRGSGESKEIKLMSRLNRQKYESIILELIKNHQYGSAMDVVESSPYASHFKLLKLLDAMRRRMLFDFRGALEESRKIDSSDVRIVELIDNLSDLCSQDEKKILEELAHRTELSFLKKDYLEGIAFLFSLVDNFLQFQLETSTGVKINKIGGEFKEFNEFILRKEYIAEKEKYLNLPTRPNLREILSLVSKDESPIEAIEDINDFIDRLEKPTKTNGKETSILDLRNKGPYAHGNMGVTEELLKGMYPPFGADGIVHDLKKRFSNRIDLSRNPFEIINNLLAEWLAPDV